MTILMHDVYAKGVWIQTHSVTVYFCKLQNCDLNEYLKLVTVSERGLCAVRVPSCPPCCPGSTVSFGLYSGPLGSGPLALPCSGPCSALLVALALL